MSNILTLTIDQPVVEWIEMLPDCHFKTQALLKLNPKCESMKRRTILDAILCARSYRESIEVYSDKDDWWMQLYKEIKNGDYQV